MNGFLAISKLNRASTVYIVYENNPFTIAVKNGTVVRLPQLSCIIHFHPTHALSVSLRRTASRSLAPT